MNIVLVEPEIPPNTGNVGRLCAATGATLHLVGPLGFRLDDRELKRAGMDYWEHITWRYWDSFDDLLAHAVNANPHPDPLPCAGKGEGISSPRSRGSRVRETPLSCAAEDQDEGPRFYLVETKSPRLYTEPRYKWGDYLVFGRETKGLPKAMLKRYERSTISIPMFHEKARSLNLATAVAIVLYEAMRQVKGF